MPFLALAQNTGQDQIVGILEAVQNILNLIIPIVLTIGFITLAWAIIQLITNKSEEERAGAKSLALYCVGGIFVISSLWGLVALVGRFFGVGQGGTGVIPCVVDTDNNALNGCQGY
jgi:TRAP-type C4-dicarboxylate transport system permease small subunit